MGCATGGSCDLGQLAMDVAVGAEIGGFTGLLGPAFAGSRFAPKFLNDNPFIRIGPGWAKQDVVPQAWWNFLSKNPAGDAAQIPFRIALGLGKGHPHFDPWSIIPKPW